MLVEENFLRLTVTVCLQNNEGLKSLNFLTFLLVVVFTKQTYLSPMGSHLSWLLIAGVAGDPQYN